MKKDEKLTTMLQKCLLIAPEQRNLGTSERILSSSIGTFLTTVGLRKPKKGGWLLTIPGSYLIWRAASGYCPVTEALGMDTTEGAESFYLRKSVYIHATPEEIYKVWREFEKLPEYFKHLKKVEKIDDTNYKWTAVFNEQEFTWNSRILEDVPDKKIAWKTVDPKDIENVGSVEFKEIPERGVTRLKLYLIYRPAKTELGRLVAEFLTPLFKQKLKNDLRRFRDQMNVLFHKEETP